MMTEFDFEGLAQSMRELAGFVGRARMITTETHIQAEALERFMHHHSGMVQAAKANDADVFVKHLEQAYHAGRIIILGLKDEQISILAGV